MASRGKAKQECRDSRKVSWAWFERRVVDEYGPLIGPYGLAVYAALCRYADDAGQCHPYVETIAGRTGMSERQVSRVINGYEERKEGEAGPPRKRPKKEFVSLSDAGLIRVEVRIDAPNLVTLLPVPRLGTGQEEAAIDGGGDAPQASPDAPGASPDAPQASPHDSQASGDAPGASPYKVINEPLTNEPVLNEPLTTSGCVENVQPGTAEEAGEHTDPESDLHPLWLASAGACGQAPRHHSRSMAGYLGELHDWAHTTGRTPEQLRLFGKRWREKHSGRPPNPNQVINHWAEYMPPAKVPRPRRCARSGENGGDPGAAEARAWAKLKRLTEAGASDAGGV